MMECAHCHKSFPVVASRVARTKYCSRACKNAARQNQIQQICSSCGTTFSSKASNHRRYCSPACVYQDRRVHLPALTTEQQTLVTRYEMLVASVSRRLHIALTPRNMDFEDFYQEGMIGLITAIQQDDDPRANFAGFAKVHIRSAILAAYRTQEHAIRLPESLFRHDANVTDEQLQQYRTISACASLDGIPSVSRTARQQTVSPEQVVLTVERKMMLYRALRTLPIQQRQLIAQHYGLVGEETAMLQLCQRYNIPRATMHRLVHRGLDSMKKILEAIA